MSISSSRLAYDDCFDVLQQAYEDPRGARIKMNTQEEANFFRMRIHQARNIDRKDNKLTYNPDDPLYGRSIYDKLTVRMRKVEDFFFIYLEHNSIDLGAVEKLSSIEGIESSTRLLDGAREEYKTIEMRKIPETKPLMIEGPVRRRV